LFILASENKNSCHVLTYTIFSKLINWLMRTIYLYASNDSHSKEKHTRSNQHYHINQPYGISTRFKIVKSTNTFMTTTTVHFHLSQYFHIKFWKLTFFFYVYTIISIFPTMRSSKCYPCNKAAVCKEYRYGPHWKWSRRWWPRTSYCSSSH
jgi:hypothetical protein